MLKEEGGGGGRGVRSMKHEIMGLSYTENRGDKSSERQ